MDIQLRRQILIASGRSRAVVSGTRCRTPARHRRFFSQAAPHRQWLIVATWIALATPLQALMRSLTPSDLESIFLSDAASF